MFQVEWIESAVGRLADAWASADPTTRIAITAASHRIEGMLRRSAPDAGESRDADRRILIDNPLAVLHEVDELRRIATIVDVAVRRRLPAT